jgi:D-methionine transport system ATP-binding protein
MYPGIFGEPMITISGLNKTYSTSFGSVTALNNVSLAIAKGDIFGIIGFSGAGKSTLVRCINRMEEPDSGTIFLGTQEITSLNTVQLREIRKKIGMIFQQFNLFESRTVFGNVSFPLEVAGCSQLQIKKRVDDILELVGLTDKIQAYPAQLSGGQIQRVGIARALANNPDLLLCDEATSSLDPKTTRSIIDLLGDINRRLGLTIIMITHEIDVLKQICVNAAVIDAGAIIETGSVDKLITNADSETTKMFFSGSCRANSETPRIHSQKVTPNAG